MRHEVIACSQRRTVSIDHVDWRDCTRFGNVGGIFKFVLSNQFSHGLQVREVYQREPPGLEYAQECTQSKGNFMGIKVFNVMGGKDCIETFAWNRAQVYD